MTDWMFLNVRRRPFDDEKVRKALNFATDRARIAELAGGPEVAVPTCQFVPRALPGHEPYCPYTARRPPRRVDGPGHGAGPQARAPRPTGRASASSCTSRRSARSIGRYFVGLLDDLGFRASLALGREREHLLPSHPGSALAGADRIPGAGRWTT